MKPMTMIIVITCILLTVVITYSVVNVYKHQDIEIIKAQYDEQVEHLISQLSQYETQENETSKFVGNWSPPFLASTYDNTLKIFSNGTYVSVRSMNETVIGGGMWEVQNKKMFLTSSPEFTDPPISTNISFYYGFYDNDTTLVLTITNISIDSWDVRSGIYTKQPVV